MTNPTHNFTAPLSAAERSKIRRALIGAGIKTKGLDDNALINQYASLDDTPPPKEPEHTPKEPETMPETPTKEKTTPNTKNTDLSRLALLEQLLAPQVQSVDAEQVKAIVQSELAGYNAPKTIHIAKPNTKDIKDLGVVHKDFEPLLQAVQTGSYVFISGPAGSGKTHAAQQIAEALDVPFYMTGAVSSEFKLTGFIDAHSNYQETAFYKAYTTGGLFLFDEIDASDTLALMALNAALAGDVADFPNGMQARHPNFYCIAAGNTWGKGANREYVGRNQLDAATLNRFPIKMNFDYDKALERALVPDLPHVADKVQECRANAEKHGLRVQITPRHTQAIAALVRGDMSLENALKMTFLADLDQTARNKVLG